MRLQLERLDDGTGIKNTLMKNNAVWHELCWLQFNETKLSRAKSKNLCVTEEAGTSLKYMQLSTSSSSLSHEDASSVCIFCEKGGSLHNASTFQLDAKVRSAAHALQDDKLIS